MYNMYRLNASIHHAGKCNNATFRSIRHRVRSSRSALHETNILSFFVETRIPHDYSDFDRTCIELFNGTISISSQMTQCRIILVLQPITKLYLFTNELKLPDDFRGASARHSTGPLNSPIQSILT